MDPDEELFLFNEPKRVVNKWELFDSLLEEKWFSSLVELLDSGELKQAQNQKDFFGSKRLLNEVESPEFGRLDRGLNRPMPRDHDHVLHRPVATDLPEHLEAIHPGQPNIQENQIVVLPFEQ